MAPVEMGLQSRPVLLPDNGHVDINIHDPDF
jgi:hypothetical protein